MAKLKIQTSHVGGSGYEAGATIVSDSYVSPTLINSTHIGGTGGDNTLSVPTIRCSFLKNTGGAVDTGYITFQKGMRKFEVANTSDANATVATLVNKLASEITVANTMAILANTMIITGANTANIGTGGGGYTNNRAYAYVTWTTANVTGNSTPAITHQFSGTGLTGNATVVAINSTTNVTVSCSTQTVSAAQGTVTESFNVARISNKYVWEWDNSKWRYWLGNPYNAGSGYLSTQPEWQAAIFVRVDNN
jgi:hypothetical protein